MTYTSLLMKLFIPTVFAMTLSFPQPVNNNTEVIVEEEQNIEVTTESTEAEKPEEEPIVIEEEVQITKTESAAVTGDCTPYTHLFEQYDWDVQTALEICKAESRGDPEAINWSDVHKNRRGEVICVSSRGLMQIGCLHPEALGYTMDDLLVPEKNIAMAYKVYQQSGNDFDPWTTYKR